MPLWLHEDDPVVVVVPQLVEDGSNQYSQPAVALTGPADRAVEVLRAVQYRRALGAAAGQTVAAGFNVERMQGELEAIYEQ